jgi:excisionase family DNA binding protein
MGKSPTVSASRRSRPETTTVPAAAKRLRIGRNQAYRAVACGQLPAIKIGRRLLIPTAALDRLLNGESAAEPVSATSSARRA